MKGGGIEGWCLDLTLPDPYHVLPIAAAVVIFLYGQVNIISIICDSFQIAIPRMMVDKWTISKRLFVTVSSVYLGWAFCYLPAVMPYNIALLSS
jgi:membrane protein insertase Oxa1/YidC/SpoIIIJ